MADQCGWLTPRDGDTVALLERHLPSGVAWIAFRTPGKVASRLIAAVSGVFSDAWSFMCRMTAELDPRTTFDLIENWEQAVSLPDECLPGTATIEQRRDQVMFRLAMRRWTTAQDWKDLAELFGLTIDVTPGWYVQEPALFGYFTFPLRFDIFPKLGRFRVYIDITNVEFAGFEFGSPGTNADIGFPIPFGDIDERIGRFRCIIERVRPANVVVIWNEFPIGSVCTHSTFTEDFSETFC